MVINLFFFSALLLLSEFFVLIGYKGLDYVEKKKKEKLINIKKVKYLFVKYEENNSEIGKKSFIFQLLNFIIIAILILLAILTVFVISYPLYVVTLVLYFIYLAYAFIFMVSISIYSIKLDNSSNN